MKTKYEKARDFFGISASLLVTELWEELERFERGETTKLYLMEKILEKMYDLLKDVVIITPKQTSKDCDN